jgi:TRAP-type uncharacterized transport system fused permease subunit
VYFVPVSWVGVYGHAYYVTKKVVGVFIAFSCAASALEDADKIMNTCFEVLVGYIHEEST